MNPANHDKPLVLAIFALTYLGVALGRVPGLKLNRTGIALLGAIGVMAALRTSPNEIVAWVSWPTIFMLFGFFVISAQLRLSGFYDVIARRLSRSLKDPARFLFFLMASTAGLSAILNNDIICYVFTPVVGTALVRRNINPIPFLVALAVSSNLGAAATLIGNGQNMMIGELAGLSFPRYLAWSIVPVLGALAAAYLIIRTALRPGEPCPPLEGAERDSPPHPLDRAHTIKGLVILAAVILLFFTPLPRVTIVLVAAAIHLASTKFRTEDLLALVDWPILILFMALFVVTGALQSTGYGQQALHSLQAMGLDPNRPVTEVAFTAALTALLNNAPAVMLMVKFVSLSHFSAAALLAVGNSFAGNSLLTASVANIIVAQQARRLGITVSVGAFARLGLPVTLASLAGLLGWAFLAGS